MIFVDYTQTQTHKQTILYTHDIEKQYNSTQHDMIWNETMNVQKVIIFKYKNDIKKPT